MTIEHEAIDAPYKPEWGLNKIQVFTYSGKRTARILFGQSVEPFDMQNGAFDIHPHLVCMELLDILHEDFGIRKCIPAWVNDMAYELHLEFPWCADMNSVAVFMCHYFSHISCEKAHSSDTNSVVYHFHIPKAQQL